MVIAIVSDAIYPYNKGGKEKRIYEFSTRLVKHGHEVHIYTMQWWQGDKVIIKNGVYIHAICKLYPLYKNQRRSIKQGIFFGLSCLKLLSKRFDVFDVDSMPIFPLYSSKLVSLVKRKRLTATWHEVWDKDYWVSYLGLAGYVAYFLEKMSVRLPDVIIANSMHTKKRLREVSKYKGDPVVITSGVDNASIRKIRSKSKKYDVIYTGRLLKHKNVDQLISAIDLLNRDGRRLKCLIVGEGPEKENLIKLVNECKLSDLVTFRGFYERYQDVYLCIKSSRTYVLPSEREGFGNVVVEANACGVPVIVANKKYNAAKDLVQDGVNGFYFTSGNRSLASSILRALKVCDELVEQCLKSSTRYDWENLALLLEEVYAS